MEFRNIFIANPAKVSVRYGQLVISQENEVSIPIQDISSIMVESNQVSLSAYSIASLAEQGVTILFADSKHLPTAQVLPISCYCRQRKMLMAQMEVPKPLQKQLWKKIVKQKILNQAECLRLRNIVGYDYLADLANKVQSGDPENVEARAAAFYFRQLFGEGFSRSAENKINALLNYGFSIVRACIARNLAIHGLEPCLGIHHKNQLNAFNLADDLIEPYRPLVELYVAQVYDEEEGELTPVEKQGLFNITNYLICQNNKRYRLMTAIERCVVSFGKSIVEKENLLEVAELLPLEQYQYD